MSVASLLIDIRADISAFRAGMTEAVGHLGRVSESSARTSADVRHLGASLEGLKDQIASVTGPFNEFRDALEIIGAIEVGRKVAEWAKQAAEFGEQIKKTSEVTGVGVAALQGLEYAGSQLGVENTALIAGLEKFTK